MATAILALYLVFTGSKGQLPRPQTPATNLITYAPSENVSRSDNAFDIPLEQLCDERPTPFDAEQVALHFVSPHEVWVTFVTGLPRTGVGVAPEQPQEEPQQPPTVVLTRLGGDTVQIVTAEVPSAQYTKQSSNRMQVETLFADASWYQSGHLWTVKLTGLQAATDYSYHIDNSPEAETTVRSSEWCFATLPDVGARTNMRIGVFGDLGQTSYSAQTLKHLAAEQPQIILNMGDLTYADAFDIDAPPRGSPDSGSAASGAKWDAWGRLTSSLFAQVPHQATHGNHEPESNAGVGDSLQYVRRYPNSGPATSTSPFFYSYSFGLVKVIHLSMYTQYLPGSVQHNWFRSEMETRLDRDATPWVFLVFHGPVYNTYVAHYKEVDCFRQVYEPLWLQYGVDLLLSGHVHAYERSNPVANYSADPSGCAPVQLTVGDGGNHEGIYQTYADQQCPSPEAGRAKAERIAASHGIPIDTFCVPADLVTYANGTVVPYCWDGQPEWSAYREDAFGHGVLDISADGRIAHWVWKSNTGSHAVSTDSFTLRRDVTECPLRAFGTQ